MGALTFILNVDEGICQTLLGEPVNAMIDNCEGFHYQDPENDAQTEEEPFLGRRPLSTMEDPSVDENSMWTDVRLGMPIDLIGVALLWGFFLLNYNWSCCEW